MNPYFFADDMQKNKIPEKLENLGLVKTRKFYIRRNTKKTNSI